MAYTTINDPTLHFQVKAYSGTGSSNAITLDGATDMAPAMVYLKRRDAEGPPMVFDTIRGQGERLQTNNSDAEATHAQQLTAFGSDGFTVGTHEDANHSSGTYVSWNWKGGTTSGITTNGSTDITPSAYSFNQTSGFSVIKYTGTNTTAQLAHGLGAIPKMVLTKQTNATRDWGCYHAGVNLGNNPEQYGMKFSGNDAQNDDSGWWGDTAPDSVNITISGDSRTNGENGGTYMAYCFAEKKGYSKFGSYRGNGSSDGTFVYTGFRPAWVMVKSTSGSQSWTIIDNEREPYNEMGEKCLFPNESTEEFDPSNINFDCLATGFKLRNTDGKINTSGHNYIFAAFAEVPLVNTSGIPCNAR